MTGLSEEEKSGGYEYEYDVPKDENELIGGDDEWIHYQNAGMEFFASADKDRGSDARIQLVDKLMDAYRELEPFIKRKTQYQRMNKDL